MDENIRRRLQWSAFKLSGAGASTLALLLAGCVAPPAAPSVGQPPQFVDVALEAARLALSTCKKAGFATTVLIADANGNPVAMLSADGAHPRTHQIAPTKIAIVRKYGVPSAEIAARVESEPALAAEVAADLAIGVARGGALPLDVGGHRIGFIAVSGAPSGAQDELCAEPAARLVAGSGS